MKDKKEQILITPLRIRYSKEDMEILKENAEKANLKLSTYIRQVSLKKRVTSKIELQSLVQMKRIGNNLNQITRIVNAEKSSNKKFDSLFATLNELNAELKTIIDKIK